jgi:plasmid stabilization system protein ParE
MKRVRFDAEAKEDLREASRWYEAQRTLLGQRMLRAVGAAVARIREAPASFLEIGRVRGSHPIRRVLVDGFPYAVVFVELADEIRVVAVAHGRRRPGYWRGRTR